MIDHLALVIFIFKLGLGQNLSLKQLFPVKWTIFKSAYLTLIKAINAITHHTHLLSYCISMKRLSLLVRVFRIKPVPETGSGVADDESVTRPPHTRTGVNIAETRRQSEKSWADSNFRANVCLKYFNQTGQEMFQKISFAVWSLKSIICARWSHFLTRCSLFQFVGVSGCLTRLGAEARWSTQRSGRSSASAAPTTSRKTSSTASSGIVVTRSSTDTFPGVSGIWVSHGASRLK